MPHYNIATKALVVILKALQKTTIEISGLTGLVPRTIDRIYAIAVKRGFDPAVRPLTIRDEFVAFYACRGALKGKGRPKEFKAPMSLELLGSPPLTLHRQHRQPGHKQVLHWKMPNLEAHDYKSFQLSGGVSLTSTHGDLSHCDSSILLASRRSPRSRLATCMEQIKLKKWSFSDSGPQ